ncbi:MAG: hypothetical protein ACJA09_001305 [Alcanivorax sp.]|jgi:hypothetical protein
MQAAMDVLSMAKFHQINTSPLILFQSTHVRGHHVASSADVDVLAEIDSRIALTQYARVRARALGMVITCHRLLDHIHIAVFIRRKHIAYLALREITHLLNIPYAI